MICYINVCYIETCEFVVTDQMVISWPGEGGGGGGSSKLLYTDMICLDVKCYLRNSMYEVKSTIISEAHVLELLLL